MSVNSDELAARVHEQLSKMDVRPTSIVSENARNLRPQLKKTRRGGYHVLLSDSSCLSQSSGGEQSSRTYSSSYHSTASGAKEPTAQVGGGGYFDWFNWKIGLALVIVTVIAVFAYKKWSVISNLGVGYAIADTPGLENIGASLAGGKPERVKGEIDALKTGTHPILPIGESVHFADEKDALIDSILLRRTIRESEEEEEEEDEEEEDAEAKEEAEAKADADADADADAGAEADDASSSSVGFEAE